WLARGYGGITSPEIAQKINVLDIDFSGITIDDIIELCEEIREYGDQNVVMLFNGGDFAYPDITVPKTISKYQDDQYKIQFSTVEKHMQSVDWDKTKIYGGEFNTAQQGTFTTNIIIKQTIRELVNHIHALERLAVLSGRSDIDTLAMWENLLKQQFHDIICGSMCDGGVQDTYTEMREARKLIYAEMEKIEDKHGKLAYFNAMDISRSEIIQKDCLKYKIDISPFGFVSVNQARILKETEKQSLPCVFENEYYEAVIDASGYISTLKDKVTGENLTQGLEIPFGGISMQMDYGDPWLNFNGPISGGSVESSLTQNSRDPYYRGTKDDFVDRRTFPSTQVTARVIEQNEEELIIEQQSLMQFWEIEFPITTIITLSKSSTLIQYKTSFVPHGKNYRMRVAFPTSIDDGVIRHEIAFGIQERDQAEYPVQNWIDYADNNKGLALINRGIPANNVDEGIMMLTLFRSVAMEYKTDSLLSYNIGIPQCFEYAIMPHSTDNDINIIQNAIAFNQPLRLCQVSSECIKENTNYTTDKDNVIVSGLRYQDKSIFVRVYEAIGKEKTTCNIKIPEDIKSYCIADGLQNAIGEKTACSYTINIQMRAFEIANILLYKE
ncbi:MAG: hypothetical protein KAQ68_06885, partial [Clostridiales bacterium]|nr:hypothetical protein [Clostridiales bacterium]